MRLISVFILSIALVTAYGLKCADVSGIWQNELGSRMVLKVDDANRLSGEFYTGVESSPGAAAFVSNITGLFSKQNDGSILAFSVLFNHGSSLASWVGQCLICGDKEVLHTTYTLRRYTADIFAKWTAVVANQNDFWRLEAADDSYANRFSSNDIHSVVSQKNSGGLELSGKWKSSEKEEIEIIGTNGDLLTGKHHSTDVVGRKDGNDIFTAVTWMTTSSKRIKSWTGHIYDTASNVPHILETTWMEHEFNPSCSSARNMVRFGAQNFTRIVLGSENFAKKSETFMDKLRKFFSSMSMF